MVVRPGGQGAGEAEVERELRLALWLCRGISSRAIRRSLGLEPPEPEAEAGPVPSDTKRAALAGDPAAREAFAAALGLRRGVREEFLRAPALSALAGDERARLAARGGRAILRGDPDYPAPLEDLSDPPEALEVRGSLPRGRAVAVVGSRHAPASARAFARELGAAAARAGLAVVSGGALGIDGAAHQGALDAGGVTLAVLGTGVLRPYPNAHRRLFAAMLAAGGGLASELPAEATGRREHFPRRNRLIAALAEAVVVIAAGEGSGSLYTAVAAGTLGRRLLASRAGAVAPGCDALLAGGAEELTSPAGLLAALGLPAPDSTAAGATSAERALLRSLGDVPRPLAALAADAGLPAAEAAAALAGLCARELARPAGPGRFARR